MAVLPVSLIRRLGLSFLGCLAGIAIWLIVEYLPDLVNSQRVVVFLTLWLGAFAYIAMVLTGPLRPLLASSYAVGFGLVVALLFNLGSLRFDTLALYAEAGHPFVALFVILNLPLPFLVAHECATRGLRDYQVLFDQAWSLTLRTSGAAAFCGLTWGVLFLSATLLDLADFDLLMQALETEVVAAGLTGLLFGLGLAVLHEWEGVISTIRNMVLQLLRLLLPVVTVVIGLFLLLLPFAGIDQVFSGWSAAATMIMMIIGAVTLISAAVEARDEDTARNPLMVMSARILSLILPVLAAVAVYAVWTRISAYGLTPPRIAALTLVLVVLAYAVAYALAQLSRSNWRATLRQGNIVVSALVLVLAALWLTPVLNAERLSARSLEARLSDTATPENQLDPRALDRLGRAGAASLMRLRELAKSDSHAALARALADRPVARAQRPSEPADIAAVAALSGIDQAGAALALSAMSTYWRTRMARSCAVTTINGNPGCAVVGLGPGAEVLAIYRDQSGGGLDMFQLSGESSTFLTRHGLNGPEIGEDAVLDAISEGAVVRGTITLPTVEILGQVLIPQR